MHPETSRLIFLLNQIFRNLIDIPSTFQLERLEQQEAQNRSNEYMSALNTVKLPKQAIRKLYSMTSVKGSEEEPSGMVRSSTSSGHSIKAPSVREVLSEKTVDPKTIDWVRTGSHQSALINKKGVGATFTYSYSFFFFFLFWMSQMASAMGELHQATESIDVEHVGDLIVTLSPPLAR